MTLLKSEIIDIINSGESEIVRLAKKTQKTADIHISGKNYQDLITPLAGYENEDEKKIRNSLAKPISVSLTNKIITELSKWQNATDTNKEYHFKDKETSEKFKQDVLSQCWENSTMESFVNEFLKIGLWNKFSDFLIVTRPFFIDINNKTYTIKDNVRIDGKITDGQPIIVHISINCVIDFKMNGNEVIYLCYLAEDNNDYKVYKLLDSLNTYTIKIKKGEKLKDSNFDSCCEAVPNELKKIPCVRLSSLKSKVYGKLSTNILEPFKAELDTLVEDYSKYRVIKEKHLFPKMFMASVACKYQNPAKEISLCIDGVVNIKGEKSICPACKGLGYRPLENASQQLLVPLKTKSGEQPFLDKPIGYADTDIDSIIESNKQLKELENKILIDALNQSVFLEKSISKTATEIYENKEPLVLLNMFFSELVKNTEISLVDLMGKMYNDNYKGSSINYGLNYANKTTTQLTKDIEEGKVAGLSITELTELHKKRIKGTYSKNKNKQLYNLIVFELEPFNVYTTLEVNEMPSVMLEDKMAKAYFTEDIKKIDEDIEESIIQINGGVSYNKKLQELKNKLITFNKERNAETNKSTEESPNDGGESQGGV